MFVSNHRFVKHRRNSNSNYKEMNKEMTNIREEELRAFWAGLGMPFPPKPKKEPKKKTKVK